jgi:hypothetical protein
MRPDVPASRPTPSRIDRGSAVAGAGTPTARPLEWIVEDQAGGVGLCSRTDRLLGSACFRAKLAQEEAIRASAFPLTILRATHSFVIGRIAYRSADSEDMVRLPPCWSNPALPTTSSLLALSS